MIMESVSETFVFLGHVARMLPDRTVSNTWCNEQYTLHRNI